MRAALAEDEEPVDPLITKEVPTTLKSDNVAVEVWKSLANDLKSSVGSEAMVELKMIEPHVKPVTMSRLRSVILAAAKMSLMI